MTDHADHADHADLLAEVRALVPELTRDAAEVEVTGAVDPSVIDRLEAAGLFRMFRPARWGGAEADPETFFRAIRLLSRGSFATGWVASLYGAREWHLALFDERAQEEVWGAGYAHADLVVVHAGRAAHPDPRWPPAVRALAHRDRHPRRRLGAARRAAARRQG